MLLKYRWLFGLDKGKVGECKKKFGEYESKAKESKYMVEKCK